MSEDGRGPGTGDPDDADRLSPGAAFALLGDETRVAILRALSEQEGPVGFSELRSRVGVADSGRFNYHLGKLLDRFVRKTTDGHGGYELTLAGQQVVGALLAGTYTASPAIDPIELEEPCPVCGGPAVAAYEDEVVTMRCTNCDEWLNEFPFPSGTLEEFDREELPVAFDRWLRTTMARVIDGFCPTCSGRVDGRLVVDPAHPDGVRAQFECTRCPEEFRMSVLAPLLFHPAVVALAHDHGLDVSATPTWRLVERLEADVEVVEADPLRVRAAIELDDDRLVVAMDRDRSVEVLEPAGD
ncbi:MAG: winged helix-turn-helix domain-containing protein [Halobacteriales archaeon]